MAQGFLSSIHLHFHLRTVCPSTRGCVCVHQPGYLRTDSSACVHPRVCACVYLSLDVCVSVCVWVADGVCAGVCVCRFICVRARMGVCVAVGASVSISVGGLGVRWHSARVCPPVTYVSLSVRACGCIHLRQTI